MSLILALTNLLFYETLSSPFTCRPSVMYDLRGPSGDSHGENGEFQYAA